MVRAGPEVAARVDCSGSRRSTTRPPPSRTCCASPKVVAPPIGRLYADAAYDSAENRGLCLREGIQPLIREVGQPHGSGLGAVRCVVEHDCAWLLADKRLDRRHDRLGRVIQALLTAACIFVVANRLGPF